MLAIAKDSFLGKTKAVLADALGHFNDDDGWAMSSNVALSGLMALFPFIIFVTALAGAIGQEVLAGRVAEMLLATWPKEVAQPIADQVHQVLTQAHGGLLTISAVVAIYLASNGVEAVRTALNRAYRVVDHRWFVFRRLQSIVFVVAGAAMSLVLAFLGVLGPILFDQVVAYVPALADFSRSFTLVRFGVTGLLSIVVLVGAHLWLPAGRPSALRLWPGILVTIALWLFGAWAFGYYLQRFANYAAYYAGLASVFSAIFFLYLVSAVMIFGAELNAALSRVRHAATG